MSYSFRSVMFSIRLVYLFLIITISINSLGAKYQQKIIGGRKSRPAEFPFIVSLQYSIIHIHFCGGTLISLNAALSSAHCFKGNPRLILYNNRVRAVAGDVKIDEDVSPSRQVNEVSIFVLHPNFHSKTFQNDLAIIMLQKYFVKSLFVSPIQIATTRPRENQTCQTAGWGRTFWNENPTKSLRDTNVSIVDSENCKRKEYQRVFYDESHICAGDPSGQTDACYGDSGGPLVCNYMLMGITSFGYGCAEAEFPGVYVFVPYYNTWIKTTIKSHISSRKKAFRSLTTKLQSKNCSVKIIKLSRRNAAKYFIFLLAGNLCLCL